MPQGFRILEKGRHLVVIHLETARAKYRRPIVSSSTRTTQAFATAPLNQIQPRDTAVLPAHHWQNGKLLTSAQGTIVQATAERGTSIHPSNRTNQSSPTPQRNPLTIATVAAPRLGVDAVIRVIYDGVQDRAEFIPSGPRNLPSLRIYRSNDISLASHQSPAAPGKQATQNENNLEFTIGIDRQRQELVVEAPSNQQQAVAKLVQKVDASDSQLGNAVRFVSSPKDPTRIAQQLKPTIGRMVAQNQQQQPVADNQQPRTPGPVPPPLPGPPQPPTATAATDQDQPANEAVPGGTE